MTAYYQELLDNTKRNCINKLKYYGLDHDDFMTNLKKYGGVIAGSFMFMNFGHNNCLFDVDTECPTCNQIISKKPMNYFGKLQECGDIDVYIRDNKFFENYGISGNNDTCYHPFEFYIKKNITENHNTKNSYMFIDGILYSRTYTTDKIDINFILLKEEPIEYINNKFDLDCCKIIYDGDNVLVFNIEDLVNGKTKFRYTKCYIDHLYMDNSPFFLDKKTNVPYKVSYKNSVDYIKFKMLYEVYLVENQKLSKYSTHTHYDGMIKEIKYSIKTLDDVDRYRRYLRKIGDIIDLESVFDSLSRILDKIELTDDILYIISMLKTLERIDKYRNRGICEFVMEEEENRKYEKLLKEYNQLKIEHDQLSKKFEKVKSLLTNF